MLTLVVSEMGKEILPLDLVEALPSIVCIFILQM